jgi:hypothetical protein
MVIETGSWPTIPKAAFTPTILEIPKIPTISIANEMGVPSATKKSIAPNPSIDVSQLPTADYS